MCKLYKGHKPKYKCMQALAKEYQALQDKKCIELQVYSVKNRHKLRKQWFTSMQKITAHMYTSFAHVHKQKNMFIHT